eukprot:TRINITY_DN514_c0_g1_i2.p1 TRINITY_DN514_c0_g1~~TRINITY_DN514_c0_g1_i2.p1  ORF type:complete len:738 (+),score=235.68 TRINITY_DN514_c0_g1_i2:82-2295(+)
MTVSVRERRQPAYRPSQPQVRKAEDAPRQSTPSPPPGAGGGANPLRDGPAGAAPRGLWAACEAAMRPKHADPPAAMRQLAGLVSSSMMVWSCVSASGDPVRAVRVLGLALLIRLGALPACRPPAPGLQPIHAVACCALACFAAAPVAASLTRARAEGSELLDAAARAWVALVALAVLGRCAVLCAGEGAAAAGRWLLRLAAEPLADCAALRPAAWGASPAPPRIPAAVRHAGAACLHRLHFAWMLFTIVPRVLTRIVVGYTIVFVALSIRCAFRLVAPHALRPRTHCANRRVLIITDYMPPQVHGIAVRCHNYVEYLRAQGDEVVVFTTFKSELKSFDYPTLPSVMNPFNTTNRVSFAPGLVLSWNLAMYQWDVVHVVFPSLLGLFVLPVCWIRGIPTYCSHHVDMDYYGHRYVGNVLAAMGNRLYRTLSLAPAVYLASANAAPSLSFLRQHVPAPRGTGVRQFRIPSGVEDCMVPASAEQRAEERAALLERAGVAHPATMLVLMVQRLAPEKGTEAALAALAHLCSEGERVHLVVAGDGPSMQQLRGRATAEQLPVTFLGGIAHSSLPQLYRGADAFLSCSQSETFGLTLMEAMACGTPAAMPRHAVFDELWAQRVPASWRYDPAGGPEAVGRAVRAACAQHRWLQERPVRSSWRECTQDLSAQYQELIEENRVNHRSLKRFLAWALITVTICRPTVLHLVAWVLRLHAAMLSRGAAACSGAAENLSYVIGQVYDF